MFAAAAAAAVVRSSLYNIALTGCLLYVNIESCAYIYIYPVLELLGEKNELFISRMSCQLVVVICYYYD
jgi:hypothetical protein